MAFDRALHHLLHLWGFTTLSSLLVQRRKLLFVSHGKSGAYSVDLAPFRLTRCWKINRAELFSILRMAHAAVGAPKYKPCAQEPHFYSAYLLRPLLVKSAALSAKWGPNIFYFPDFPHKSVVSDARHDGTLLEVLANTELCGKEACQSARRRIAFGGSPQSTLLVAAFLTPLSNISCLYYLALIIPPPTSTLLAVTPNHMAWRPNRQPVSSRV